MESRKMVDSDGENGVMDTVGESQDFKEGMSRSCKSS